MSIPLLYKNVIQSDSLEKDMNLEVCTILELVQVCLVLLLHLLNFCMIVC